MIFLNMYGMSIHIPFADLQPNILFFYTDEGDLYIITPLNDDGNADVEHYGKFETDTFLEIKNAWKAFKEEYSYNENLLRWVK